jgi:hypothetical protein
MRAKPGKVALDGADKNNAFADAVAKNLFVPGVDVRLALGRVRE